MRLLGTKYDRCTRIHERQVTIDERGKRDAADLWIEQDLFEWRSGADNLPIAHPIARNIFPTLAEKNIEPLT
jgi:hypothetical protein